MGQPKGRRFICGFGYRFSYCFYRVGETTEDLERFEADRFISRLLGMGDLKSLLEKAEETIQAEDFDMEAMLSGNSLLKICINKWKQ